VPLPAITVIVPLYNKAETVEEAVTRALGQNFPDLEVIVVDDGSTDGSADRLAHIRDPRLTILRQANAGVSAARNRAILAAQGQWLALLDADDLWETDHLACLMRAVETHQAKGRFVAAFCNARYHSSSSRTLLPGQLREMVIKDYFSFALALGGYVTATSATLLDREATIAAGLFPVGVALGEDIDLWCRLALRGPLLYTAAQTMSYDDRPDPNSAVRHLNRLPEEPVFALRLPMLIDAGAVPSHLRSSAERYANFLMLEYARQLLDRGLYDEARAVLLKRCTPDLDLSRYLRRLIRTWPLGRAIFRLSGKKPLIGGVAVQSSAQARPVGPHPG
jgi:glycosyltransferase involved in cell wall biosynthesis